MTLDRATLPHHLRHFSLNLCVFSLCYLFANALAQQQGITRHLVFPFEAQIPFLQWMIVPYMSSGIFFCLVFFCAGSRDRLRMLSQRILLATVLATLVFLAYPLQFSWPRPAVSSGLCAILFNFLSLADQPYNQLPSLHVAYCLIFWQSLRQSFDAPLMKILLAVWLFLMAVATLFTYQHHLLDVFGGLLLGLLCIRWIRKGSAEPNVAFYYLMAASVALIAGVVGMHSMLAAYAVFSLLLVSLAYYRRDRHFLHKAYGRHRLWVWCLYSPYLIGYRLTWHAVVWRERRKPVVVSVAEKLWAGRRLTDTEARQVPESCTVIDLSCEIDEATALRSHRYFHFPLLDLVMPPPEVIDEIVALLNDEIAAGRAVYLHCAMGYSRCILLGNSYLAQIKQ